MHADDQYERVRDHIPSRRRLLRERSDERLHAAVREKLAEYAEAGRPERAAAWIDAAPLGEPSGRWYRWIERAPSPSPADVRARAFSRLLSEQDERTAAQMRELTTCELVSVTSRAEASPRTPTDPDGRPLVARIDPVAIEVWPHPREDRQPQCGERLAWSQVRRVDATLRVFRDRPEERRHVLGAMDTTKAEFGYTDLLIILTADGREILADHVSDGRPAHVLAYLAANGLIPDAVTVPSRLGCPDA